MKVNAEKLQLEDPEKYPSTNPNPKLKLITALLKKVLYKLLFTQ